MSFRAFAWIQVALIVLLLSVLLVRHLPAATPAGEDLTPRIVAFETHWERFVRAYWGCPPKATVAAECTNPGILDYAEFNQAARRARKLFALEGDK